MNCIEYFIKGEQLYSTGCYEDAIIYYDLAVQNNLEYYKDLAKDLFYNRGLSLQALGYHYDAIEDFDKAIIYLPDNCQLYHFRSISKSATLDLKGQVADLLKAIELSKQNSKDSEFWNEYARKTGYSSAADKYNEDLFIAQGRLDTELQFEKFIEDATSPEHKRMLEETRAKDRLRMLQNVKKKRQFPRSSNMSTLEKKKEVAINEGLNSNDRIQTKPALLSKQNGLISKLEIGTIIKLGIAITVILLFCFTYDIPAYETETEKASYVTTWGELIILGIFVSWIIWKIYETFRDWMDE